MDNILDLAKHKKGYRACYDDRKIWYPDLEQAAKKISMVRKIGVCAWLEHYDSGWKFQQW